MQQAAEIRDAALLQLPPRFIGKKLDAPELGPHRPHAGLHTRKNFSGMARLSRVEQQ